MLYYLTVFIIVLVIISVNLFIRKIWRVRRYPHRETPSSLGLSYEEVWIPTNNNRKLFGWWSPGGNEHGKLIILQHGWGRNAERMLQYMDTLKALGYTMMAVDFRGHGRSDQDEFPNMYKFSEDIVSIVDYAQTRIGNNTEIAVIGHSAGGAAAISAAGRDKRIQKVITLGAPAHPRDVMEHEFNSRNMPKFISKLLLKYIEFRIGRKFDSFAPSEVISKSTAEILVIHGSEDKIVPVEQANKLGENRLDGRVRLWIMQGIGHSNFHDYPGFSQRLAEFIYN